MAGDRLGEVEATAAVCSDALLCRSWPHSFSTRGRLRVVLYSSSAMDFGSVCPDQLEQFEEDGITVLADSKSSCSRKSPFYFSQDLSFVRTLVCNILAQYLSKGEPVSFPAKCVDVLGGTGISGLLWKKHLKDSVDVRVNNVSQQACDVIRKNAKQNDICIEVTNSDPCCLLYERGYHFIYLDCTNDAAYYFEAAFRNISRNGVLVVTAKDDCSLHGSNPDVAMRRYNGRITRVLYFQELGLRLFIAALARAAAKFNKSITVLCCVAYKNTFTVAVQSHKGPILANKSLENIRLLKHCMVCENRKFYPLHDGFTQDPDEVKLDCNCATQAPGKTTLELGPLWSDSIFDVNFIEGMLSQEMLTNLELRSTLSLILEEARCPTKVSSDQPNVKRLKHDFLKHPPFYFNIHKHHPQLKQLMKLNEVVDKLRALGYRASKTHFDKLAIRTDAPLGSFLEVMKSLDS